MDAVMAAVEGVHGAGGHQQRALGLDGNGPLAVAALVVQQGLAIDAAGFGAGIGPLPVDRFLFTNQQQVEAVDLAAAGLRDKHAILLAGQQRMGRNLHQRGTDGRGGQQLPHEEHDQGHSHRQKGDGEAGEQPVGFSFHVAVDGPHHEPRHQAVPCQAGQQEAQQPPGGRIAHRQPEAEPGARTAGDVAAIGHAGEGLDGGAAGGQQVARRACSGRRGSPPISPSAARYKRDRRRRWRQTTGARSTPASSTHGSPAPAPPPRAGPGHTSRRTADPGHSRRWRPRPPGGCRSRRDGCHRPRGRRRCRRPCSGFAPRGGTARCCPGPRRCVCPARCRCAGRSGGSPATRAPPGRRSPPPARCSPRRERRRRRRLRRRCRTAGNRSAGCRVSSRRIGKCAPRSITAVAEAAGVSSRRPSPAVSNADRSRWPPGPCTLRPTSFRRNWKCSTGRRPWSSAGR